MIKHLTALAVVALLTMVSTTAAFAAGPHNSTWPFFTVLHPSPTSQIAPYWSIPSGDGVQYYGQTSDPDQAAFVEAGQEGTTRFAQLRLMPDPNFTPGVSYNNAEIAGVPTGYSQGTGDQLFCHSEGHQVNFTARVRWSPNYANGTALGSTGLGLWNSPVTSEGVGPAQTAFLQVVPGVGPSAVVTYVQDNQTQILAFNPVSFNPSVWNTLRVEISRVGDHDEIDYFRWDGNGFVPLMDTVETPSGVYLGCGSVEMWADNLAYDEFGNVFMQNPTEEQWMNIDWMIATQT